MQINYDVLREGDVVFFKHRVRLFKTEMMNGQLIKPYGTKCLYVVVIINNDIKYLKLHELNIISIQRPLGAYNDSKSRQVFRNRVNKDKEFVTLNKDCYGLIGYVFSSLIKDKVQRELNLRTEIDDIGTFRMTEIENWVV